VSGKRIGGCPVQFKRKSISNGHSSFIVLTAFIILILVILVICPTASASGPPTPRPTPPQVGFDKCNYTVNEGEILTITINLTNKDGTPGTQPADLLVHYYFVDLTAKRGEDYDAQSSIYFVTIPRGQSSASFTVQTRDDGLYSSHDNTFKVCLGENNLNLPTIHEFSRSPVLIKEASQQPTVQFDLPAFLFMEGVGTVNVSAMLSNPCTDNVDVTYMPYNGTAYQGIDYNLGYIPTNSSNGLTTINPGETRLQIPLVVLDDGLAGGPDKTFIMSLIHMYIGGALVDWFGAYSNTTLIIRNTLLTTVQLEKGSYSVDEDAGTVTVNVTINGPVSGEVVVGYATSDGTALSSANYTTTSGTVTFAVGNYTPQPITVPIRSNGKSGGDRFFFVNLTGVSSGVCIGSPDFTWITIKDTITVQAPTPTPVPITPTSVPVTPESALLPTATQSPALLPTAATPTPVKVSTGGPMMVTLTPLPEPSTSTENTNPGSSWSLLLVLVPIAGVVTCYYMFTRIK
jgi:hypothetical protein